MEKTSERQMLNRPDLVNLCLDFYSPKRQCGRLYHQYRRDAVLFSSLTEALKEMGQLYDELQYPQTSVGFRSFLSGHRKQNKRSRWNRQMSAAGGKEVKKVETFESMTGHRGKEATFFICVKFRQHASWQGEVIWIDGRKTENFRSALELVWLMDSVFYAGKQQKC